MCEGEKAELGYIGSLCDLCPCQKETFTGATWLKMKIIDGADEASVAHYVNIGVV